MAKLTVYFKDSPIQSNLFEGGTVRVGRDPDNEIVIDSLAVAPCHAVFEIDGDEAVVKQASVEFPIMVNGIKSQRCELKDNDKISLGKHDVIYNVTEANVYENVVAANAGILQNAPKTISMEGNLQIMDGQYIGRVIPLKKTMTRLGSGKFGIVVISKRKEGFFLSALEGHPTLKYNNKPLGDSAVKLQDNDKVVIDNTSMLFFHSEA